MGLSLLKGLLAAALAVFALSACATEEPTEEAPETTDATSDELRSAPVGDSDMVAIPTPAGMPKPWDQPDSTGYFGEQGKCGPTALANDMLLYNIQLTPTDADKAGVHFLVGTLQWEIEAYLKKNHPELGCTIGYPWDGAANLRKQLDSGHPVMVWFNTEGSFSSHWVTVVGHKGVGNDEKAIVMSWGRYYEISMEKLDNASKWLFGMRHPSVSCSKTTNYIVK